MSATLYDKEVLVSNLKADLKQLIAYVEQAAGKEEIHTAEKEIFRQVRHIGYLGLQLFVQECGTGYQADNPPLSEDGKPLRYKDDFDAKYLSIFGELAIPRAGYHDESLHRYHYPLDAQLNLPQEKYSYLLTDWVLSRATETDYRDSVELFNKIFELDLTQAIPQRMCKEVSPSVAPFYEEAEAPPAATEGSHLCITADGKGISIVKSERQGEDYKPETPKARRAKGEKPGIKKEATVTVDYSFNPGARTPEEIVKALLHEYTIDELEQKKNEQKEARADNLPLPRMALNKHQRATLRGKDQAMELLMQRLAKRDPDGRKEVVALIDGAPSLESALTRAIKKYGFQDRIVAIILDIIHVCEYVWEAGTAIYGEKSCERLPWVRTKLLAILNGQVGYVIGSLKQIIQRRKLSQSKIQTLNKAIKYFTNHQHMMKYDEYLAKGYPIGTGVVEGACGSLVKNRMGRSGMRWKINGAEAMLDQRAVNKNGDWQEFMQAYVVKEKSRLYADNYQRQKKTAA